VKKVGRKGEETTVTTLKEMIGCDVDMATIIVGNSTTRVVGREW
jgi:precorrin-3B methylase